MALIDFHLPQELDVTSDDYVSDEFEYKDDVFYSELRKQVLQLTAEEEEEDEDEGGVVREEFRAKMAVAAKQGLTNGGSNVQRGYYNWPESKEEDNSAPKWISNLWRNTNGTGVFIPQIVPARRKNRPRKKKGGKGKSQKRVEKI